MKKIGKIIGISLLSLMILIGIVDIIRVAGCQTPWLKIKTSCEYDNNHSIYKEIGLGYEYIEDSYDEGIGGIIGNIFGIKACDIPAGNLTSCRIESEYLNDDLYTPVEERTKVLQQSGGNWSYKGNVYPTEWLKTLDSGLGVYPYGNFSSKSINNLIFFESISEDGSISRYAIYDRENHKWLFDCFDGGGGGGYIEVDESIDIDSIDVMSCKEKYHEAMNSINQIPEEKNG